MSTKGAVVVAVFVCGGVAFSGCEKRSEEIKVYRLVKAPVEASASAIDEGSVAPSTELPPSHPPIGSTGLSDAPSASVPANWEAQPLTEMRKASYVVHAADGTSADISFVALGATAGNVLDNVNRWLGQLGQPPVTDAQLPDVVQHLPSDLGHVALVDLKGLPEQGDPKKDGRILAAIATGDGATSFYKMRGNTALVEAEKQNFINWVTAMRQRR